MGLQDLPTQEGNNLSKCSTAMTVFIFFFAADFGVSASELFEEKHRIVAKAIGAARLVCNRSFCEIGDNGESAAILCKRTHANESRGAFATDFILHLTK